MVKKKIEVTGLLISSGFFHDIQKGDKPWNTIRTVLKGNWKEVGCVSFVDSSGSGNGIY